MDVKRKATLQGRGMPTHKDKARLREEWLVFLAYAGVSRLPYERLCSTVTSLRSLST